MPWDLWNPLSPQVQESVLFIIMVFNKNQEFPAGILGKDALEGFLESRASLFKQNPVPGLSDEWLFHLVISEPTKSQDPRLGWDFKDSPVPTSPWGQGTPSPEPQQCQEFAHPMLGLRHSTPP